MGLSDSRSGSLSGYVFPSASSSLRVSQVPRLLFQHTPSPFTPESQTAASTRFFIVCFGLPPIRRIGRSHPWFNEADSGSLSTMAYAFVARGFADGDCSPLRSLDYLCYE